MKLVTVNSNKSTTVGGVEGLIRSLQTVLADRELVELFCTVGTKEIYPESSRTCYIDYSIKRKNFCFDKIFLKINQIKQFYSNGVSENDIVVLFHPNDLLYMPFTVLKKATIILVQTNRFDIYFKPLSKLIMVLTKKHIDYVTVYTEKDKTILSSLYPDLEAKARVIPRGCRIESSKVARVHSKKLVSVARIDEEQKNFTAMLDIFSSLPDDYSLDIYGGGSDEELRVLKDKINTVPGATFKGEVADNLAEVLQRYSVFLMTSRYEGFGQTLIEARSQGLPIVVFDNFDALSFIVEDGFNGFTVENNNQKKFAEKIIDLCENEALYKEMTQNSLLKAKETESDFVNGLWKDIL